MTRRMVERDLRAVRTSERGNRFLGTLSLLVTGGCGIATINEIAAHDAAYTNLLGGWTVVGAAVATHCFSTARSNGRTAVALETVIAQEKNQVSPYIEELIADGVVSDLDPLQ